MRHHKKFAAILLLIAVAGIARLSTFDRRSRPALATTTDAVLDEQTDARILLAHNEILPHRAIAGDVPAESAFAPFDSWAAEFMKNAKSGDPSKVDEQKGAVLAEKRLAVLEQLIESSPEAAMKYAISASVREAMPPKIKKHLEEKVSGRGELNVYVSLPEHQGQSSQIFRHAIIGGKEYTAFVYGRRRMQKSSKDTWLHGIAVGKKLALSDSSTRLLDAGEVPDPALPVVNAGGLCPVSGKPVSVDVAVNAAGRTVYLCSGGCIAALGEESGAAQFETIAGDSWSEGVKTVLYIRTCFPENQVEPQTLADAQDSLNTANNWFIETSFSKTSLTPTFTPLIVLPHPESYYVDLETNDPDPRKYAGFSAINSDARTVAVTRGYDPANFTFTIVRYNGVPGKFSGIASVRGNFNMLKSNARGTCIHELGHNYGLFHANFWSTTDGTVIGTGANQEYGDIFDVMGNSGPLGQFNAWEKRDLEWLLADNVTTITASGTYRVHALDTPNLNSTLKYGLAVRKDTTRNYWMEFRQKSLTNQWVMNGLLLHWSPYFIDNVNNSNSGTQLLDTAPSSSNGRNDSPIVIGQTYSDFASGVHITPIRKGGTTPESIDVVVNVGSFPSNVAPVVNLTATSTTVPPNANVTLTATASDANGDTLAYAWDFSDGTLGTNNNVQIKSWASTGTRTVTCTVSDMKGGVSTKTISINVSTVVTYTIAGRVTTSTGTAIPGVAVGDGTRSATTNSNGDYVISGFTNGTYSISAAKPGYSFMPNAQSVTVSNSNVTGRNFTGAATNSTPVANNQSVTADEDVPVDFTLNATDANGDPLTVTIVSGPVNGTLSGTMLQRRYTGSHNFNGTDSFTYRVSDGQANSNTATVTISVRAVNDAPILASLATASPNPAVVGQSIAFNVSATDVDSSSLTYSWVFGDGTTATGASAVKSYSVIGVYTATATVSDGLATLSSSVTVTITTPTNGGGKILREWWTGITGNEVSALTSNPNFPNTPSGSAEMTTFEAPTNWADNYGTRMRGLITAPQTGGYVFWIAGDDNCELWLSGDAEPTSKVKIASISGWTTSREWTKFATQQSAPVNLVAGRKYYIEALHKEGGGGDNLAVGWRLPDSTLERPIPSSRLSLYTPATITGTILREFWTNIGGTSIASLTGSANFPNSPSGSDEPTLFEAPTDWAENYGTRMRGYVHAPVSGDYVFWIAGDDNCELWLSTDATPATKVLIASVPDWTGWREWTRFPSQQSVPIKLVAGQKYYIEALHKEGGGGDNLAVGWRLPDLTLERPIPGNRLAPWRNAPPPATGAISRQYWMGISGTAVSALTSNVNYPNNPTGSDQRTLFEGPTGFGENYGTRMRGYVHPPVSGSYTFWISGDDNCELWLSTSSDPTNKVLIAGVPDWTSSREWTRFPSQQSSPVTLNAGTIYYIEALHKEGGGGDNVAVGWQLPDGTLERPIPGNRLSPYLSASPLQLEGDDTTVKSLWTVTKLQGVVSLSGSASKKCTLAGTLADFPQTGGGATVVFNVGGIEHAFVLDANGKARSSSGTVSLKRAASGGEATLSTSLKSASWSEGVGNSEPRGSVIQGVMQVTVEVSGKRYEAKVPVTYTSKSSTISTFKLSK